MRLTRCRSKVQRLTITFIALALIPTLAACQSGPLLPTQTPIPLAATATPSPRVPRPTATVVAVGGQATSAATTPATATPIIPVTATARPLSELDDRLAERAAADFLARLAAAETEAAFRLHLTDQALYGEAGTMFPQFASIDPRLVDATLLEFRRATATSYEARALLRWSGSGQQPPASQPLTLVLVYQRGLWRIDRLSLGDLQAVPPTAPCLFSNPPQATNHRSTIASISTTCRC